MRTKFCVPHSNRFTELAAVRKSFNNFLLPLLFFTQHQLVHAKLIHTSTEKQKNTIQLLFLSFFSPMAINNFIDKNANDPLNRTCESIHHFHNCPQPTLFTLRSISATLLLGEDRGLILPNSEKKFQQKVIFVKDLGFLLSHVQTCNILLDVTCCIH